MGLWYRLVSVHVGSAGLYGGFHCHMLHDMQALRVHVAWPVARNCLLPQSEVLLKLKDKTSSLE